MSATLECKDCTKRFPGCHGKCESYQKWKAEHEEAAKKWSLEKSVDRALAEGRVRCGGKVPTYAKGVRMRGKNHQD